MKEKIKNNKKYIKETILLLLGGIIINLACFLMGTIYSHAETITGGPFPYYFDKIYSYSNSNNNTDDIHELFHLVNQTDYIIQSIYNNNDMSLTNNDVILLRLTEVSNNLGSGYLRLCFTAYINPQVETDVSQNAIFSSTSVKVNYDKKQDFYFRFYPESNNFSYNTKGGLSLSSNYSWILGAPSVSFGSYSSTGYSWVYTPNYPVYLHNANSLSSPNGSIVMAYSQISVGDFTDLPGLDEILNNIQNTWEPPSNITGHALPNQPTENPNNNDFQNRLQMFDYLKDSINAIVGNLGYNLKKWFDSLIGKMVEGFNSVSQNIWNGFKTLMDNIKDFFGPKIDAIIEKFNYITEPFDSQELADNLNNGSFSGDMLGLVTTVGSFSSTFTSATEPQSCSFTLDFTNNGYFSFGVCTFSFDWILPFRSYIRLFLGCLCVYSLIVSIFTSINTYIGGTSSINDDI